MFDAEVRIELKPGILDAEGKTVKHSLELLGFDSVQNVESIKVFKISINADSKEKAKEKIDDMCQKLLANPVVNNYNISIQGK
ncbi:MAG: phosphoribosylformylglycinamidine synthase subunit PurS [Candidatus Undinarchaeales archaeon]